MASKKKTRLLRSVTFTTVAVLATALVSFVVSQRVSATSPTIGVGMNGQWVAVNSFDSSASVTLSYDTGHDGTIDFTDTHVTDGSGNTVFNIGMRYAQAGDYVEVTGGAVTKTLLVPTLRTEYVNHETDVVAGVAPPSTLVSVFVQQAGPPLAQMSTTSDAAGAWSVDFTGTYDIEPDREVRADVADADGDTASSTRLARSPYVAAGYSQSGANSLTAFGFTPGTSVRMQVDLGGDGSFDIDTTKVITTQWGEMWDLGGFDVLRPGDHIIATGGGWTKDLITVPLRFEKMDAATDSVSGMATAGDLVTIGINPVGSGPWVASLSATADASGRWSADFSGTYDFEEGRSANANISDSDGDVTTTGWVARTATFGADIEDGPPSGVWLFNFAVGTEARVRADYGNDGGSIDGFDVDITETVTSPWGHFVSFGGSGLLHAGDRIVVTGGGWEKSSVLVPLAVTVSDAESDVVSGSSAPGQTIDVYLNPPPDSPGGPAVAHLSTTADSFGQWSVDFTPVWDLVEYQGGWASVIDSDGDTTTYGFWGRMYAWPKSGFFSPVSNPPVLNIVKAGSSVPVRFSLDEFRGYDIFAEGFPKSQTVDCASIPDTEGTDSALQKGKRLLSYSTVTQRYEFNWRTDKSWKGTCRQFVIKFADGTWMRANFKFG